MCASRPLEVVPPPWCLYGAAYAQCFWGARANRAGSSSQQTTTEAAGRPGILAFLRYEASNVGPYDELLWLSLQGVQAGNVWRPSVTTIFVSTEASVVSGRANWGIRKELANFEVNRVGRRVKQVRVTRMGATIAAFTIEISRLSVPASLTLLPRWLRTLVQVRDGSLYRFTPSARGRLHRASFSELSVDPKLFPGIEARRRVGACSVQKLKLEFPAAEVQREPATATAGSTHPTCAR